MSPADIQTKFSTLAAEGDIYAQHGSFTEAIGSYTKALALKSNDKHCLVARSRCHINSGSPELSLRDANESLKVDPTFFKGVFQKAEALYSMGDFENALVFYHRGHGMRPEIEDFRIGISKSREAIENSIGNPKDCKIHVPHHLRKKVGQLMGVVDPAAVVPQQQQQQQQQRVSQQSKPSVQSRNIKSARLSSAAPGLKYNRTVGDQIQNNFLVKRGIAPPPVSTLNSSMESKLLGDMFEDKVFLSELIHDKDLLEYPNDELLRLISDGLKYLHTRTEFWGQQNPLYARTQKRMQETYPSTLRKNHSAKQQAKSEIGDSLAGKTKTSTLPPISAIKTH
jgi:tetratricopeptide (TPR) repeat protein